MAIRELLSEFGIGVDLSQVVAAEGALGRVQGLAARVAGSLGQVGGKALSVDVDSAPMAGLAQVTDFAKEALLSFFSVQGAQRLAGQFTEIIGEAGKLNDQSEKLGVSAEYLQRFSYAVGLSGVEGEGAAASLGKLSRVLGDAVGGGESAKVFRELGVEFQTADKKAKPLSDIVSQLADKVKGAGSEAEAAAFLTKAFGKQGAALIPAFKQGGEALERLGDELDDLGGLMSEDFVKAADDVGDDLDRIKVGVKGVGIQIASVALPYVSRLVAMLVKWAKSGAAVLKETNALKTATIALGTAGVGFLVLRLAQLARAYAALKGPGTSAADVAKGLLGIGAGGALTVAAVATLYLLFDDLFTLMSGGESVIGKVLDDLFGVGASAVFVAELKGAWEELNAALQEVGLESVDQTVKDLAQGSLTFLIERFVVVVRVVGEAAKILANFVKVAQSASDLAGRIKSPGELAKQLASGQAPTLFQEGPETDQAKAAFAAGVDRIKGGVAQVAALQAPGALANSDLTQKAQAVRVPVDAVRRGEPAPNQVTQTISANITVEGATTNEQTGAAVSKAVGKGFNDVALKAAAASVRK